MKKLIKIIAATATLSMLITTWAGAAEFKTFSDELSVYYEGENVYANSAEKPIIINDRTMVPLRPIFEAMGWANENIVFDEATQSADFSGGDASCTFVNESSTVTKYYAGGNAEEFILDVPAVIYNGRFYIPLRAFCEIWEKDINWSDSERSVYVYEKAENNSYSYSSHMGTWYYAGNSDSVNIEPLIITDNGNNLATVEWGSKISQITFISDNVAEGNLYDANGVVAKMLYVFENISGVEAFEIRPVNASTGEVIAQTHVAYRNEKDFFAASNTDDNSAQNTSVTGAWKHINYPNNYGIDIEAVNGKLNISITALQGENAFRIVEADANGVELENNIAVFEIEDSFGNTGKCKLEFVNDEMRVSYEINTPYKGGWCVDAGEGTYKQVFKN